MTSIRTATKPALASIAAVEFRPGIDMVRRRSTVRLRNGAPGHGQFSNGSDERRGPSPGDALQLPFFISRCSEGSDCTARARAAVAEGSRRRAVPGQSGHCPREVTPGRSPSGRAVSGFDEPHQDPGPVWRLLVSSGSASRGLTSTSNTAASPGSAARSETRTPAHRFTRADDTGLRRPEPWRRCTQFRIIQLASGNSRPSYGSGR